MLARLLECRKFGNAGTGIGRGKVLHDALMRKKVAAVRHNDVCAIAAGPPSAEGAGGEAEEFLAPPAHRAFPAADPWVGYHFVAGLDTRGMRPECCDLASDFVSHREQQMHATRFKRDPPLIAQVEVSVPDMDVAVADPGSLDAQQHLLALGLRIWVFPHFQRLSPFDDLHCSHKEFSISRVLLPRHRRSRKDHQSLSYRQLWPR